MFIIGCLCRLGVEYNLFFFFFFFFFFSCYPPYLSLITLLPFFSFFSFFFNVCFVFIFEGFFFVVVGVQIEGGGVKGSSPWAKEYVTVLCNVICLNLAQYGIYNKY